MFILILLDISLDEACALHASGYFSVGMKALFYEKLTQKKSLVNLIQITFWPFFRKKGPSFKRIEE